MGGGVEGADAGHDLCAQTIYRQLELAGGRVAAPTLVGRARSGRLTESRIFVGETRQIQRECKTEN